MADFYTKFISSKKKLIELSKNYKHWVIMYSGGKDSTTALITSLEAALETNLNRVDVIYSDTLLEIPPVYNHSINFINYLKSFEKLKKLNIYYHITKPAIDDSFWVCLLGKGYPPPHQKFRWCTQRLKIRPADKVIMSIINGHENSTNIALITGIRFKESIDRDRKLMIACSKGGECGQGLWTKRIYNNVNITMFAPIVDWEECDVWDFLNFYAPTLGYPTRYLEKLYNGRDTRFGCWLCTVVRQDKALERMIRGGYENLRPLLEFRNYVIKVASDPKNRYIRKDGTIGRLTIEARKHLLEELLRLQEKMNMKLISEEEIEIIKQYWKEKKYGDYELS
jgi:DNA sulfur modification protein DndC